MLGTMIGMTFLSNRNNSVTQCTTKISSFPIGTPNKRDTERKFQKWKITLTIGDIRRKFVIEVNIGMFPGVVCVRSFVVYFVMIVMCGGRSTGDIFESVD